MRFWSSQYVHHLEAEIAWLRTQMLAERQKWEMATAELVRLKTDGQASVHPRPLMAQSQDELLAELGRLQADPEFARVGE